MRSNTNTKDQKAMDISPSASWRLSGMSPAWSPRDKIVAMNTMIKERTASAISQNVPNGITKIKNLYWPRSNYISTGNTTNHWKFNRLGLGRLNRRLSFTSRKSNCATTSLDLHINNWRLKLIWILTFDALCYHLRSHQQRFPSSDRTAANS